jgi:transcriptional regulator with XRE-family HTH domain
MKPDPRQNPQIDARLAELLRRTPRGHPLSLSEIAAAAGCSKNLISRIELNALKKLRRKLDRPEIQALVR